MAVKNMVMGAPLAPALGNNNYADSEKRKFSRGHPLGQLQHVPRRPEDAPHQLGSRRRGRLRGHGGQRPHVGHSGGASHRPRLDRFLAVDRVGLACMEIDASCPAISTTLPGRPWSIRSEQNRRGRRQDRRRAKEVSPSRRHRPHARVARPHAGLPSNLGRNRRPQKSILA